METSRRVFVVVAMVAIMVAVVGADSGKTCCSIFPVAGRSFTLVNKPIPSDGGVKCPDANPNTLDFYLDGTVKIVGNFAGANLGVCDPSINYMTIPANTTVTYEVYCDTVIFRYSNYVPAASRFLMVGNQKLAIAQTGQIYGISVLTDVGPSIKKWYD